MRRAALAALVLVLGWQLVARAVEHTWESSALGPEPAPVAVSAVAPESAPPRADRERPRKARHARRVRSAPRASGTYDESAPPPDRPSNDGAAAMIAAHQRAEMARIATETYEDAAALDAILNP